MFSNRVRVFLFAIAASSLVSAAFVLDRPVAEFLAQPISSGQTQSVLRGMRCWGEGVTIVFLLAGAVALQRQRWKEILCIVPAVLICAGTVDLIKPMFSRPRPDQVLQTEPIEADGWNSSFPSGHTATAFAFGSGLTTLFPPLRPICLVAASGTGLSRMYEGRHFFSDCVAGGLFGWFLGGWLVRRFHSSLSRLDHHATDSGPTRLEFPDRVDRIAG